MLKIRSLKLWLNLVWYQKYWSYARERGKPQVIELAGDITIECQISVDRGKSK